MKRDFISINLKLVGSLCNLNCQYCYEHEQYGNNDTGTIKVTDIIAYIDKLENEFNYIKIILHGGEPLLYPKKDMKRLLKYYKDKTNINISIQTNGLLIDQEWIDIFKNYSKNFLFSISFFICSISSSEISIFVLTSSKIGSANIPLLIKLFKSSL